MNREAPSVVRGSLSSGQRKYEAKPASIPALADDKHFGDTSRLIFKTGSKRARVKPCGKIAVLKTDRAFLHPPCEIQQAVASHFTRLQRESFGIYAQLQKSMYCAGRDSMCHCSDRPQSWRSALDIAGNRPADEFLCERETGFPRTIQRIDQPDDAISPIGVGQRGHHIVHWQVVFLDPRCKTIPIDGCRRTPLFVGFLWFPPISLVLILIRC